MELRWLGRAYLRPTITSVEVILTAMNAPTPCPHAAACLTASSSPSIRQQDPPVHTSAPHNKQHAGCIGTVPQYEHLRRTKALYNSEKE